MVGATVGDGSSDDSALVQLSPPECLGIGDTWRFLIANERLESRLTYRKLSLLKFLDRNGWRFLGSFHSSLATRLPAVAGHWLALKQVEVRLRVTGFIIERQRLEFAVTLTKQISERIRPRQNAQFASAVWTGAFIREYIDR